MDRLKSPIHFHSGRLFMGQSLRVLVVADNLLSRAGLSALLDNQDELFVVGQTTTAALAKELEIYRVDIVLLDLGWQATESRKALAPLADSGLPLLVLLADEADAPSVLSSLASFPLYGLLLNENDPALLLTALQTVAAGLLVIDPALSSALAIPSSNTIEPLHEDLTLRENEVLQLLAQGLTNKGIAHQLGITDHTVKFHVNAIMTKLGAQSRTEAVIRATRAGLIIL
jgi:two-component system, NarL family, nitrate/nitrite response regulator NarL